MNRPNTATLWALLRAGIIRDEALTVSSRKWQFRWTT
jgi:hypothetical protein